MIQAKNPYKAGIMLIGIFVCRKSYSAWISFDNIYFKKRNIY